ncbi:PspC family transcriptional regulator [Amycolatopsis sp. WAC 01375]|uniref:PspC domain-containing protein n=1 Tax=unclassified Amycolatopsis TaxID=2618356 RepID=UPI000F784AE3|nr:MULTISPECIES: PspC domain-containing protein [unclassified Amycolatopsis]RSM71219.1 PspC family transcriptional regulator [Amycolatopsis sp. WAC 01375]RSN36000.1 PspC family transcriptional regulator [Amycolatopsis sp. WAC 01416]
MSGSETQVPKRGPAAGFEETVKDFWRSRPVRPVAGRKFAGVAAGIGYRYGIDPTVVRVALVAATVFGGFGVFVYLLGWLFLPQEGDPVSAFESLIGRGRASSSPAFAVMLLLLLFPGLTWTLSGGWMTDGTGLIGLALMAVALYLLHRNRGQFNRPTVPAPAYPTAAFSMASASAASTSTATEGGWDPLAADPSAWDLPNASPSGGLPPQTPPPPPAPPAPRGRKSKIGAATFGIAVLVGGVGTVLGLDGEAWFTPQHVVGLTLGVVGIGLVAGAFVRGGRGLIGLAVPLAIVGMALTTVPFENFSVKGGVGDLKDTPSQVSEVLPEYHRSAGNIDIDLTKLPAGASVSTTVSNGAGNSTVLVPMGAEVKVSCETGAGDIDCLGQSRSGVGEEVVDFTSPGTNGQKITVKVETGVGNVEVRRG